MAIKKKKTYNKFILIIAILLCLFVFPNCIIQEDIRQISNNITTPPNQEVKEVRKKPISVIFGGDVMMDSYFADYINTYGVDYSWTEITPLLKQADISVINLETSVSDRGQRQKPKGYGFRSQPFTLEGLVNANVALVSLANNHTYDFGKTAFLDTLSNLSNYGIEYCGAGNNLEEATTVKIIERNNLKVGFLSYSKIIPSNQCVATESKSGIAIITKNNYDKILNTIKIAKQKCDLLFVLLHWGTEYSNISEKNQIELAHQIIDHGADGIIGHHPHVLQGIEIYNNKPILYSIGNLLFLKKNDTAGKTALFQLNFKADQFQGGSLYPIHIKHCKANLLAEDDSMRKEIINRLINLSKPYLTTITDQGTIIKN